MSTAHVDSTRTAQAKDVARAKRKARRDKYAAHPLNVERLMRDMYAAREGN